MSMENKVLSEFLNTLSPDREIVYRSITKQWVASTIQESIAINNKEDNIYFLWWVNPKAERLTDNDIDIIHYIRIDIDIKKQAELIFWIQPRVEDILQWIDEIKERLDKDPYFSEYSYIVFSWWWCHVYYSNINWIQINNEFTPKMFQLAMKKIYNQFSKIVEQEHLAADMAICNTARIMRLPFSINQKNWQEVKIIYSNPTKQSRLFNFIERFWIDEIKNQEKIIEQRKLEIEEARQKLIIEWKWDTDFKYEIINKIPAYLIAQLLIPNFPFDWKKNFRNNNWWFTWYYYIEETNAIANGGSRYFNWWTAESSWNNFSLVKNHLWLDNAWTFLFFEDKFKL